MSWKWIGKNIRLKLWNLIWNSLWTRLKRHRAFSVGFNIFIIEQYGNKWKHPHWKWSGWNRNARCILNTTRIQYLLCQGKVPNQIHFISHLHPFHDTDGPFIFATCIVSSPPSSSQLSQQIFDKLLQRLRLFDSVVTID